MNMIVAKVITTVVLSFGVVFLIYLTRLCIPQIKKGERLAGFCFSLLCIVGLITFIIMFNVNYKSKCENCGEPRQPQSNYCTVCGTPYNEPKKQQCPHCHTDNEKDSTYCKKCGELLNVPEE